MYTPFRVRTGIHTYNNDYKTTKIVALTDKKKKRIKYLLDCQGLIPDHRSGDAGCNYSTNNLSVDTTTPLLFETLTQ